MKLIYLGEELNPDEEKEIFAETEFGFNVTVVYKEDSWMSKHEGKKLVEIRRNCTEVHNLYNTIPRDKKRIAFESDIHCTGGTRDCEDIESVTVVLADKLEESYYHYED